MNGEREGERKLCTKRREKGGKEKIKKERGGRKGKEKILKNGRKMKREN